MGQMTPQDRLWLAVIIGLIVTGVLLMAAGIMPR